MTNRLFVLNEEVAKEIANKIAIAKDNPVSKEELKRCCADHIPPDRWTIPIEDRRPGWVHPPAEEIVIGDGNRIAISFEDRGHHGICRHIAFTVDNAAAGVVISKEVVSALTPDLGINPFQMISCWLDEYEPGKWRLNYLTREYRRN